MQHIKCTDLDCDSSEVLVHNTAKRWPVKDLHNVDLPAHVLAAYASATVVLAMAIDNASVSVVAGER